MNYKRVLEQVLDKEAKALLKAKERLNEEQAARMVMIYEILRKSGGNLIFCGVGKSGIIATKLASTFSSLGLPSYFLHPVEALHGDLGRMSSSDALVLLSKSGTTEEILKMLPFVKVEQNMIIGLLGVANSPIGQKCGIIFDCAVEEEACIHNQAPTTSSTLALSMGDALAVLYETFVGLSKEGFAENHPGGILGKSLRLLVKDLMIPKDSCPCIPVSALLKDALIEMTRFPVGLCAVLNADTTLAGIIVEGDIRRTLSKEDNQGTQTRIADIMAKNPVKARPDALAYEALEQMEQRERPISVLPVVDEKGIFHGTLRLHDLLKEGFLTKNPA